MPGNEDEESAIISETASRARGELPSDRNMSLGMGLTVRYV
jgi:hypothetical protein